MKPPDTDEVSQIASFEVPHARKMIWASRNQSGGRSECGWVFFTSGSLSPRLLIKSSRIMRCKRTKHLQPVSVKETPKKIK